MTFMIPPIWTGVYALLRYQYQYGTLRNFAGATLAVYAIVKTGLYSSESELDTLYRSLYLKYKHEVRLPKYRGLKLRPGKTPQQADEREFTNGTFEDLKALIHK